VITKQKHNNNISMIKLIATILVVLAVTIYATHEDSTCPGLSSDVKSDLAILNYALTLEHLEYAFYRDGLEFFDEEDVVNASFTSEDYERLGTIRDHEETHVETLSEIISSLGGTPVSECEYDFSYGEFADFLSLAAVFENTGVGAYLGQLTRINSAEYALAAGTIATVEARHAAYLNILNDLTFSEAFDEPLNMSVVLSAVSPFIVSCPEEDSQCFGISGDDDSVCSGHGVCAGPDLCICEQNYGGENCSCISCPYCDAPDECCNDVSKGLLCYSPQTHSCVENDVGDNVLCGQGDAACGTVCYNDEMYDCVDGSIQQKQDMRLNRRKNTRN